MLDILKKRLIPILLIENGRLVKTINFSNPRYLGDPLNALRIFNEKCADEINNLCEKIDLLINNENYSCTEVLRLLPGKRLVVKAQNKYGQQLVLKLFAINKLIAFNIF